MATSDNNNRKPEYIEREEISRQEFDSFEATKGSITMKFGDDSSAVYVDLGDVQPEVVFDALLGIAKHFDFILLPPPEIIEQELSHFGLSENAIKHDAIFNGNCTNPAKPS